MFKSLFKRKKSKSEIGKDEKLETFSNITIKSGDHKNLILIVDDSEINRDFMRMFLERLGYESKEASNGREALGMMEDNVFTLIYVDVTMPIMDGITMTKIVRKLGYKKAIVGLTGHVDADSIKECKEAGMDTVLAKPVDLHTIKYNTEYYLFLFYI